MRELNQSGKIDRIRVWLWIVFAGGLFVAFIFKVTQKGATLLEMDINTLISFGFFAFAFIIFFLASKCLRTGRNLAIKISKMSEEILTLKQDGCKGPEIIDRIRDGRLTFEEKSLDDALEEYKEDVEDMLRASDSTYLDIDSYVNNTIIDREIKTHFLNQISGTMTGLGILGTFLGLSVGLNSFNLTGSSSDITNQIQPLMEGIKVAFHTSIFGLIYSIGFNFVYRQLLETYHEETNRFLAVFRQSVVPISDNGTESSLIKYQKKIEELLEKQLDEAVKKNKADAEQTERMNKNLELMQETMFGTKSIVDNMRLEISSNLNKAMVETVVPEIQKMGHSIEQFANSTQKNQAEELSRVVDAFIQDMNKALGNSFKDLEAIINETNDWQKRSLEEMQNVLGKVQNTTVDLTNIDVLIQKAIESVSNYTSEVEKMQEAANRNLESLNVQCDLNNEIIQSQTQKLTEINEKQSAMQNDMLNAMKQTEEMFEKTTKYVEESYDRIGTLSTDVISKIGKQIDSVNEIDVKAIDDLSNAADKLGTAAESLSDQMHDRIKDTFITFDHHLTNITSRLAGVIHDMEKVTNRTKLSYDSISGEIEDGFRSLQEKLEHCAEGNSNIVPLFIQEWEMYRQTSFKEK